VDPRRVRRRWRAGDERGRRRVDARRAGAVGNHALDRRHGLGRSIVLVDAEDLIKALVFPDRAKLVAHDADDAPTLAVRAIDPSFMVLARLAALCA